jgi:hypothetical protein
MCQAETVSACVREQWKNRILRVSPTVIFPDLVLVPRHSYSYVRTAKQKCVLSVLALKDCKGNQGKECLKDQREHYFQILPSFTGTNWQTRKPVAKSVEIIYGCCIWKCCCVTAYVQDERCCLRFLALLSIGEFKTAFFAKFYQHDVMALVVWFVWFPSWDCLEHVCTQIHVCLTWVTFQCVWRMECKHDGGYGLCGDFRLFFCKLVFFYYSRHVSEIHLGLD